MDQDQVDTPRVVLKDGTRAEYQDADVEPGERAEIVVEPDDLMREPVLRLATIPRESASKIEVETVYHGRVAVVFGRDTADHYEGGLVLRVNVTKVEPVKVVVINCGDTKATVGVSLVTAEPSDQIGD